MSEMIYGVHDKPNWRETLLFSIQMVLAVFVASVLIANIVGVSASAALVGAGIGTLAYVLLTKAGSPMFISSSGAFVAPCLAAMTIGGSAGLSLGGVVSCLVYCLFGLAFFKISPEKIYKVLPKALIGAITCVIGINLMPFCLTYVQIAGITNIVGVGIALFTMFIIALVSHYAKGVAKILPFLIGTLAGYAVAAIITLTGIYPVIDFSVFQNLRLFAIPEMAFMSWNGLSWTAVASIVVSYLVYTVSASCECLSDHAVLGNIINEDLYQKPGLGRIFCGIGVANLLNGAISGLGSCSYGESVATIGFSRVASVRITIVSAFMMILLGFFGPIQAFIASIPSCVFCGAALILYSYIAMSGVKTLKQVDLENQKNLLVASVALSLGVSGLAIGGTVFSLSGVALAVIVGIILNLVLKDKEA